jgi:hypothetical protein
MADLKILAIASGEYGDRHVANIRAHGPAGWTLTTWVPPKVLPMVIDEPEEFLPSSLPQSDLVLAFQEDARAAQLIADIAKLCKAKAVIAPVDREEWMPRGLVRQLARTLLNAGIAAAFPKPLCSLTESAAAPPDGAGQPSAEIAEFARVFGRPSFEISCDPQTRKIASVRVALSAGAPVRWRRSWSECPRTTRSRPPAWLIITTRAWPAWASTLISATP